MRAWLLALALSGCSDACSDASEDLSGRVVDAHGAPIAARLFLRSRDNRFAETLKAKADDDGRYAFAKVEPGRWKLTARAPRLANHSIPIDKIAGKPIRLNVVLDAGETIRGRVVGTKPGGWFISIIPHAPDNFEEEIWERFVAGEFVSAADGTFVVEGLNPGAYRLSLIRQDVPLLGSEEIVVQRSSQKRPVESRTRVARKQRSRTAVTSRSRSSDLLIGRGQDLI